MSWFIAASTFALSAYASYRQGQAVDEGERLTQEQLEIASIATQVEALAEENERLRKLRTTQAEMTAMASTSGMDQFAGGSSFMAFRQENERIAEEDIRAIRFNAKMRRNTLSIEHAQSELAGKSAEQIGLIRAGTTLFDAATKLGLPGSTRKQLATAGTIAGQTGTGSFGDLTTGPRKL